VVALPDHRTIGTPWSAKAGESYLSVVAASWLAVFGPRSAFVFRTQRRETTWQQWQNFGLYNGLAKFHVGPNGLLDEEPISSIPRKKPCRISSRQWARG